MTEPSDLSSDAAAGPAPGKGNLRLARTPIEPLEAFAELGRINLSDASLDHVLNRVAELAKAVIPGTTAVSVTLVTEGVAGTAAYTGEPAIQLDEAQYESGYGPCLDAAAHQAVHVIADMGVETRWPEFAEAAAGSGVHSSLSIGIPIRKSVTGAINIYGTEPDAFDSDAVALGQTFAGYAAVALANVHLYSATQSLAEQMAAAMESRAVIEQAKGLLVGQQGVSPDEAFAILSRASQQSNRKLRDIAQAIIDGAQDRS